ncbi:MAG: FecR family protein [Bauldia sp.]
MFTNLSRTLFGAALLSLTLAGAASAEPWQITQSTGPVWFGSDQTQLVSLGSSTDIPGGQTVVTGEGARVMLVRGEQTMLIGANSVVTVPDADEGGITTILQRSGEVTFDVDRQKVQHFAVETPYLAAVVKGTMFTVDVDAFTATVSVDRGLVEVSDLVTGEKVDTAPGQRAAVSGPGAKLNISGSGLLALISQGEARAPLVAPLSSDGLRALQTKARGGNSTQALNSTGGDINNAGLAAIAAGGGNGGGGPTGGTGGDVTGGPSGGGSAQNVALYTGNDAAFKRHPAPEQGVSPLTFALAAAFLTLLALAWAYVRRNA